MSRRSDALRVVNDWVGKRRRDSQAIIDERSRNAQKATDVFRIVTRNILDQTNPRLFGFTRVSDNDPNALGLGAVPSRWFDQSNGEPLIPNATPSTEVAVEMITGHVTPHDDTLNGVMRFWVQSTEPENFQFIYPDPTAEGEAYEEEEEAPEPVAPQHIPYDALEHPLAGQQFWNEIVTEQDESAEVVVPPSGLAMLDDDFWAGVADATRRGL